MIVLPSSESNFFDYNQIHSQNNGSGINTKYPDPLISGYKVYGTFPSGASSGDVSIFNNIELQSSFSSASEYNLSNNFKSFNNYIHYYPKNINDLDDIDNSNRGNNYELQIPYISSFKFSLYSFDPYAPRF
jgi:hypothetical protein